MKCASCGNEFEGAAKFCGFCGAPRPETTPAAAPAAPAAPMAPAPAGGGGSRLKGSLAPEAPPPSTDAPVSAPAERPSYAAAIAPSTAPTPVAHTTVPPPATSGGDGAAPPPPTTTVPGSTAAPSEPDAEAKRGRAKLLAVVAGIAAVVLLIGVGGFVVVKRLRNPPVVRQVFSSLSVSDSTPIYAPLRTDPSDKWTYEPTAPVDARQVSGSRLYLLQHDDQGSILTAVGLDQGNRIWEEDLQTKFTGSLDVVGDHVILTGSAKDGDKAIGKAMSYNTDSHKREFEKELDGTQSTVLGHDGNVVFIAAGQGGSVSDVVALDVSNNGSQVWGKSSTATNISLGKSHLYLLDDETITAYDLGNGNKNWSIPNVKSAQMTEVGDMFLVAPGDDKGRMQAYDLKEGKRQWDSSTRDESITGIGALDDGTALVSSGDRLVAIDVTNKGNEKWTAKSLTSPVVFTSSPMRLVGVAADTSSTSSSSSSSSKDRNDRVLVFDTEKGDQVSSVSTKETVSSEVYADQVVYVYNSSEGRYSGFDLSTGERLWKYTPTSKTKSSSGALLAVDNGVLIFTDKEIKRLG